VIALALRRDQLGKIAALLAGEQQELPTETVVLTDVQRRGLIQLLSAGAERGDEAIVEWFRCFGTDEEQPMVAAFETERDRLDRLARAVLKADGTLMGPEVRIGDLALMAGDHVIVGLDAPADGFSSPGMVGRVDSVDAEHSRATVDFCFDGILEIGPRSVETTWLRYDYTAPLGGAEVDLRTVELREAAEVEMVRIPEVELP
jgi:hypothetical protein